MITYSTHAATLFAHTHTELGSLSHTLLMGQQSNAKKLQNQQKKISEEETEEKRTIRIEHKTNNKRKKAKN